MDFTQIQRLIDKKWANNTRFDDENDVREAVFQTVAALDKGEVRVCEPARTEWKLNEWVKKAILLYFKYAEIKNIEAGDLKFYDKIGLKSNWEQMQVRAVPTALARYGSYLAHGVVLMPSYVNIGAYIDSGTMVDTWATVGSCAQIGKNVHLSGGVGIGGVLEPMQEQPVIIEDGCFVGSRCVIVEGVRIGKQAVIGAGVILTASTKIYDVSGTETQEYIRHIPQRSVVIQGSVLKEFPSGKFNVPCALIIGQRKKSTNLKTSLNDALRNFNVPV